MRIARGEVLDMIREERAEFAVRQARLKGSKLVRGVQDGIYLLPRYRSYQHRVRLRPCCSHRHRVPLHPPSQVRQQVGEEVSECAAFLCAGASSVQWKVQGGSPEGTLAWIRQKGCFGGDDKVPVVLASTGREAMAALCRRRWLRYP